MAEATTWEPSRRLIDAVLVGVVVVNVVVFLAQGVGFVLDDWFVLRNAHFGGAWEAAGSEQGAARPGSWPVFALVFGAFGLHPLPGFLLLALVNAATAVLTFRLLDRFIDRWQAALVALLWVVLPTHTSTEMWLTCTIIATSQLCLTAALVLLVRTDRRVAADALALLLLAASVLTYEASLPVGAAASVGLVWFSQRRLDLRISAGCLLATGLPGLWILSHWYSGKHLRAAADPVRLLQVNFGWGITPNGPFNPLADLLVVIVLVGVVAAVARVALPSFSPRPEDGLVLVGLSIMVLGFAPFVRYFYEPQGAGDRMNYLSAVGAAMVWTGLVAMVVRVDWRLAVGSVAGVLALALPARLERIEVWATAGRDAQAIADHVVATHPDTSEPVVLGPGRVVRWNVAAMLDHSNVHGALAIAYGTQDIDVQLLLDRSKWTDIDPSMRVDIRAVSELDDLSVLAG